MTIQTNGATNMRGNKFDGSLDINIQDQISIPFHRYFMTEDKIDIGLTSQALNDDYTLNVTSGHGFSASGEYTIINYGSYYQQSKVTAVNGDIITLDTPISMNLPTSGTQLIRGNIDMNIDGSIGPVVFYCRIGPNSTDPVDISSIDIFMQDNLEGDDSKYGGIPELSGGTFARYSNTIDQNLGIYKSNSDYIEFGSDVEYTSKAGGGNFAMHFHFDLKDKYGIVLRLYRSTDDISITINDDLTDLVKHRVVAFGQITEGESIYTPH